MGVAEGSCCAGWWFRPEFIINELNINSAITSPAHDEVLTLGSSQEYTIQGYAYTGEVGSTPEPCCCVCTHR